MFFGIAINVNAQLLQEDFETTPLTGWTFYQTELDDPGFVQTSSQAHGGTYSFYHNDDNIAAVSSSWMVSPSYSCAANTELSFWYYQNWTASYYGYSGVWISTGSNDPITNPGDFTELQELNATAPGGFSEDAWTEYSTILSAYSGQTIYIAFKYTGDFNHELWIDDFSLFTAQPYSFALSTDQNSAIEDLDSTFTYNLFIYNTGTNPDTFNLSYMNNMWTTELWDKMDMGMVSSIIIPAGITDTIHVKVTVPGSAVLGDFDTVDVHVVSASTMNNQYETFTTYANAPIVAPYLETLEDDSPYRDLAWQIESNGPVWDLNAGTSWPGGYPAMSGTYLAYFNSWSVGSGTARVYAKYDLSATTNTQCRYWMFKDTGYPTSADSVQLQVSSDAVTWTNVGPSEMRYDAAGDMWHEIVVDLSAYDGQTVYIGIEGGSGYGNDIHVDDIYVGPDPTDLVITEIMYNPPEGGTDSLEFWEVYNNSGVSLDVSGFEAGYGFSGSSEFIPAGTILYANDYIVFSTDSAAFEGFYGFAPINWTATSGLSNGGSAVWIKDLSGNLLDSVNWDDVAPWPTEPDGNGPSLVFCDVNLDNNDGANWGISTTFVDTNAVGDTIWASPGAFDNACYFTDLAYYNPPFGTGHSYTACDMGASEPIYIEFENTGNMQIPAGDTIFFSYQINALPVVPDTMVLAAAIDPGSITGFTFAQTADFSNDGIYNFILTLSLENDLILANDTSQGLIDNFIVDVTLPGTNDTLTVGSYPANIDAGTGTSGGHPYGEYSWSTGDTTQIISVNADGWYTVTVTTAEDSMGNFCTAVDSVYVLLVSDINEYEIGVNIYPNPNSGTFTMDFQGNTEGSIMTIFNTQGQIIRSETLTGDLTKVIDLSGEAKGLYYIRIMNEEYTRIDKVIIQ